MGESSNTTKQPDTLDAVRALLQAVQSPLTTWSELLEAATGILTDLDPPLGLVAFSPFAALRTPETAAHPPASPPRPRQPGVSPAPPKPVFALPPRKGEPSAPTPSLARNSASAAVALAQGHAAQQPIALAEQDGAAVQALLATMTQVATLTDTLLTGARATAAAQAMPPARHDALAPALAMTQPHPPVPGGELLTTSPARLAPLLAAQPPSVDNSDVPTLLTVADGTWGQTSMASTAVPTPDGALAETMALLADLTDTLFTSPNAGNAAHAAPPTPGSGARPSAATLPAPPHTSGLSGSSSLAVAANAVPTAAPISPPTAMAPAMATPGLTAETVREVSPFPAGTESSVMPPGALAASPALSTAALSTEALPVAALSTQTLAHDPLTPPDAWTLAQLINDVLAEEARRHGVDLS